jgi:hypothetical protein
MKRLSKVNPPKNIEMKPIYVEEVIPVLRCFL